MLNLIGEMIRYIMVMEEEFDWNMGGARTIEQIIIDHDMPKIYYKLLEYKERAEINNA